MRGCRDFSHGRGLLAIAFFPLAGSFCPGSLPKYTGARRRKGHQVSLSHAQEAILRPKNHSAKGWGTQTSSRCRQAILAAAVGKTQRKSLGGAQLGLRKRLDPAGLGCASAVKITDGFSDRRSLRLTEHFSQSFAKAARR